VTSGKPTKPPTNSRGCRPRTRKHYWCFCNRCEARGYKEPAPQMGVVQCRSHLAENRGRAMATSNPAATATYFEGVCPILPVSNVQKSVDYYRGVLGFKLDWQVTGFASVTRGKC